MKNTKKDKSSNDFLAYYNTFYTAEQSFNKAIDLIDSQYEDVNSKIPTEALNLLEVSIKNSLIIIEDFYNSSYVDDACFILARSSLYKDKLTVSNYYLNKIINDFPNSKYVYSSNIWSGFIYLRLGDFEALDSILEFLELNIKELDNSLSLYYELLAEKSLIDSKDSDLQDLRDISLDNAKNYFLLAVDNVDNSLKKKRLYFKLLEISENQKMYDESLIYIKKISDNSDAGLSAELLDKWFDYNRITMNYETIYIEIDNLIQNNQLTTKQRIFYLIQKIRTFVAEEEDIAAIELIDEIIKEIKDNKSFKMELSELYFLKGDIYLKYNSEYDMARDYFEKCINSTTSQVNEYKLKAELLLDALIKYASIEQEYLYLKDNAEDYIIEQDVIEENNPFFIPLPDDYNKSEDISDSLLYSLGQILYFDLDKKDSSLVKLNKIINSYPKSKFRPKSMFVLSLIDSSSNWIDSINLYYPNSIFLGFDDKKDNSMDSLRNIAWNKFDKSFESGIEEFKYIFENYNDPISCYIIAFIYDHYKLDLNLAAEYYAKTMEYEDLTDLIIIDDDDFNNINNKVMDGEKRLNEIADVLSSEIDVINHKIAYNNAIKFIINESLDVDSLLLYLENAENGALPILNQKIRSLFEIASNYNRIHNLYISYDSLKINDSLSVNYKVDSLLYNLSKLALDGFNNIHYTKKYSIDIVDNYSESSFLPYAYSILNYIEPSEKWDSLIYLQNFDSTKTSNLINYDASKIGTHVVIFDDVDLENDLIFFKDSKKIINSYFVNEDTLNMQIDTIRLNTKD